MGTYHALASCTLYCMYPSHVISCMQRDRDGDRDKWTWTVVQGERQRDGDSGTGSGEHRQGPVADLGF